MLRPTKDRQKKPALSSLSQLRFPLVFFGLALILVESSFGVCLFRYSTSEHILIVLASWMGTLFIIALLSVSFLTYKVPTHIMLESQVTTAATVAEQTKRIKNAVSLVLEYSEAKSKDPKKLLLLLDQVETLLAAPTQEK